MAKDTGGHGSEKRGGATYTVASNLSGIRHLTSQHGKMSEAVAAKKRFEKQNPGYEGGWRIHSSTTTAHSPAKTVAPSKPKIKKYSRY